MARHAADLPEDKKINPDLKYRFVNHLLDRSPARRGPGLGTVLTILLLLSIGAGTYFVIDAVLRELGHG